MPSTCYSLEQLALIRLASRIVAEAREVVREMIRPGVTTRQIDAAVARFLRQAGASSPFLGYRLPGKPAFPATVCASVNEVVVHGIPDERPLAEGDLVSIDIGVRKDGYIGDSAWTFGVGRVSPEAARLLAVGEQALREGVRVIRPGVRVVAISQAIQDCVEAQGFSVVREFVGHGVGRELHEDPQIPNFVGPLQRLPFWGPTLRPGMVLAVEPMVNQGGAKVIAVPSEWAVQTADGSLSVHFEHTLAVHLEGVEILTELRT